ncbi:MAG: PAS domain-containing protein [Actinobacteria bacterium]|nr:PAS domain-containing protein [Actinomycetota bacterium]MCA1719635.1 PAS domain-containing protein [Actinomycetota bacterium]
MSSSAATFRLLGVPVRLLEAASEQWNGMIREYALRAMSGAVQPYGLDEITRASNALAAICAAVPTGSDAVDVDVAYEQPADFSVLQGVLDAVAHLSGTEDVLVLPSLPEVIALRNWMCQQVADQHAGGPAVPWRLDSSGDDAAVTVVLEWDRTLTPEQAAAWIVGDDHNRIVAASEGALALLGWTEAELVGQRLLVVIPQRLREAHIAGFTRSVVNGGGPALGTPLSVPALARDGSEIPVVLTLTRHAARAGRHVYLGRLEPR